MSLSNAELLKIVARAPLTMQRVKIVGGVKGKPILEVQGRRDYEITIGQASVLFETMFGRFSL